MRSDFAAFILTHGRPDRVFTLNTLRESGYKGRVYLVVDDEDKTLDQYRERYGEMVVTFSKEDIARRFDQADNFDDRRSIFYARNACWHLAKELNVRWFVELDDDYSAFQYRWIGRKGGNLLPDYHGWKIRSLEAILEAFIEFQETTPTTTIAMSQGGDHFGGGAGDTSIRFKRKAMNSFICDADNPFPFSGRVNEDVNTYVLEGLRGRLFFTYMPVQLTQRPTQSNQGGMTELYLDSGTYIKSFYTILHAPASTEIRLMGQAQQRLHHFIHWDRTAVKILPERYRKRR